MPRIARLLVMVIPVTLASACGGWENAELELAGVHDSTIIQGEDCTAAEYPTAVALLIDATLDLGGFGTRDLRTVVCTGTLIAPDVVLTAAHCVDASALTLGLGTVERQEYFVTFEAGLTSLAEQSTTTFPADTVDAAAWIPHPDFSLDAMNEVDGLGDFKDIALILLAEPVTKPPAIVITTQEAARLADGSEVAIAGWGQQTQTGILEPPPPGTVGKKQCANSFINELGPNEMQIGDKGARKCHGDSGGPTYFEVTGANPSRRVVGITSHAYDMEDCAKGGVDTRLDAYLSWVDAELTDACSDGIRAWCEVPGIIPPSYYAESGDDNNAGGQRPGRRTDDDEGCRQTGEDSLLAALMGVLWLGVRRSRPT